jgi:hypothetical protein
MSVRAKKNRRFRSRLAVTAALAGALVLALDPLSAHAQDVDDAIEAQVCPVVTVVGAVLVTGEVTVNSTPCATPAPEPAPVPVVSDVTVTADSGTADPGETALPGVTTGATSSGTHSASVGDAVSTQTSLDVTADEAMDVVNGERYDDTVQVCHRTNIGDDLAITLAEAAWVSTRSARGDDMVIVSEASCPAAAVPPLEPVVLPTDPVVDEFAGIVPIDGLGSPILWADDGSGSVEVDPRALGAADDVVSVRRAPTTLAVGRPESAPAAPASGDDDAADDAGEFDTGRRVRPFGDGDPRAAGPDSPDGARWTGPAAQDDSLPGTGADIGLLLLAAATLCGVGVAAQRSARRRSAPLHVP